MSHLVPISEPEPEPPAYCLETGELAPAGDKFVPLKALERYTHTYVEGANRFRVWLPIQVLPNKDEADMHYNRSTATTLTKRNSMHVNGICKKL